MLPDEWKYDTLSRVFVKKKKKIKAKSDQFLRSYQKSRGQ